MEGVCIMDLLKFFIKDEVPAVGLSKFKDNRDEKTRYLDETFGFRKQYFKPDYSNNFFIL